jgi:hypothetical protein
LKLEEALQSIPGCADVMLPFWDESSPESLAAGIPWALTQENFRIAGPPSLGNSNMWSSCGDFISQKPRRVLDELEVWGLAFVPRSSSVGLKRDLVYLKRKRAVFGHWSASPASARLAFCCASLTLLCCQPPPPRTKDLK